MLRDSETIFPTKLSMSAPVRKRSFMKAAKPPKQGVGAVLGYGRVSRESQDLAQQCARLRTGWRLFEEKAPGGQ